jgi:hypothetical protein
MISAAAIKKTMWLVVPIKNRTNKTPAELIKRQGTNNKKDSPSGVPNHESKTVVIGFEIRIVEKIMAGNTPKRL